MSDGLLDEVLGAVHEADYLDFLRSWSERLVDPALHLADERSAPGVPQDTPLWAGVYLLAREGARVALGAALALTAGEDLVYALCRPPGHHAGPGWFGGYCFLNNASVAVEAIARSGRRPGVLDLDFHLGNGTAAILGGRSNCRYASVHAATADNYPWRDDLPGVSADSCIGLPTPPSGDTYSRVATSLADWPAAEGVDTLVVSLGYDMVAGDPHGGWMLGPADLGRVAVDLARHPWPICVVQEGGYNLATLADRAASFALGLIKGRNA